MEKTKTKIKKIIGIVSILLGMLICFSPISKADVKNINRYAGGDAYHTSVKIAEEYIRMNPETKTVILATGNSHHDAVSGSPLVEVKNAPILLVTKNKVPDVVLKFIYENKIENIEILGGEEAISQKAINMIKDYENTKNLSGAKSEGVTYVNNLSHLSDKEKSDYVKQINSAKTITDVNNIKTTAKALNDKYIKEEKELATKNISELTESQFKFLLDKQGVLPKEKDLVASVVGDKTKGINISQLKPLSDNTIAVRLKDDNTLRIVKLGGIKFITKNGYQTEVTKALNTLTSAPHRV